MKNKMTRYSYRNKEGTRPDVRLKILHADWKGPFSAKGYHNSIYGMTYLFSVIDDYSSYKWVFFMKKVTQIAQTMIDLLNYLNRQYPDSPVKILRTDGAKVFTDGTLAEYCRDHGIQQQVSHPHSQEENGGPERYNRTLMEVTRSLLQTAQLPDYYWPEAAEYANRLLNRLPTRRIAPLSPYEKLGLGKPNLNDTHAFGCMGFAYIPEKNNGHLLINLQTYLTTVMTHQSQRLQTQWELE